MRPFPGKNFFRGTGVSNSVSEANSFKINNPIFSALDNFSKALYNNKKVAKTIKIMKIYKVSVLVEFPCPTPEYCESTFHLAKKHPSTLPFKEPKKEAQKLI